MLTAVSWSAAGQVEAQGHPAAAPQSQTLTAAVTIERGVTCLDSEELVEHVASWLGTDRVSAPLTIEVHGSPHFARTVWFRIRRGSVTLAERRFEPAPSRCDDLHAAVGLAIALALKASLRDALFAGQTPDDAAPRRPFRLAAQALGGLAVVPGPDFGVGLSFQRAFAQRFAARLSAVAVLGPYGDFRQDRGHFRTWLTIGRLDVCSLLAQLDGVDVSICVGVAAGGLHATGEAFPTSRSALTSYVALANALELDVELGPRWSLTVAVDVLVRLRRTSFVVRDQAGTVLARHDLSGAGALLAVGPAYHF